MKKSYGTFGLVTIDCGCNAWTNNCTNKGREDLQNALKGMHITEDGIIQVFNDTKFMSIGGKERNATKPIKVVIHQFFPEDGFVKLGAYDYVTNDIQYGATIYLRWDAEKAMAKTKKNDCDDKYDALEKKYKALEKKYKALEKRLDAIESK